MSTTTRVYCPKCGAPAEIEEAEMVVPHLCQGCGNDFVAKERDGLAPAPQFKVGPVRPDLHGDSHGGSGANHFGVVLGVIGALALVYFAFFFDTSVTTSDGTTVVNLGLSNDRLVGVIAGGVIMLSGVVLAVARAARK